MKVAKNMLNKELQSSYWMLRISGRMLMNKTGVRMLNSSSARSKGKTIEGLQCEEKLIPSRNGGPDIRSGTRVTQIVKTAGKEKIGLIVMGTKGSASNSSLLLGSNSHRVVSGSGIPVLTVRKRLSQPGYSRILLPVDSSEHSRQKVHAAVQIARLYGASIRVLGMLDTTESDYRSKLEVILHQVTAKIRENHIPVSSETVFTGNAAGSALLRAAQTQADLIIAMRDQHTGATKLLSRSFDHQLVDESDIPVLSIPPEVHYENIDAVSIGGL
jgi:nucleotide-binding universal stress UspA family protein